MKTTNIHFEQIPVETVKRIAEEFPENDATNTDPVTIETKDQGTHQERWREMARKVQVEKDPQRMVKIVEELIAAFDEEQLRKSGKTPRAGLAT